MSSDPAAQRSEYMLWAKTRQGARFNLAVSGVPAVSLNELPVTLADLELTGPSTYGWPPLQDALARHLGVPTERIVHAEGTSMANHLVLAVCVRPGDEVLIEQPTYGLLLDTARYFGAVIRRFPRRPEDDFQPDLDDFRRALTPRTRLVIVSNLHNPSSAGLGDGAFRSLAGLVAEAGARLLVDEVYLDADFAAAPRTAHRFGDQVLATSSLTKVYGLSGLRCGWVVAAPDLAERLWRLQDLFGVIPAHPAERLSRVALEQRAFLQARVRGLLARNLQRWAAFQAGRGDDLAGFVPSCGTVVFPRLRHGSVDLLCERLRQRHDTTVVPGRFFELPDHFRVGLGVPTEAFAEGLRRLGLALDSLRAD